MSREPSRVSRSKNEGGRSGRFWEFASGAALRGADWKSELLSVLEVGCDDRDIGFGEVEGGQFDRGDPAKGDVFCRGEGLDWREQAGDVGNHFNVHRRVGEGAAREGVEELDAAAEFFLELAMEGGLGGFTGLKFAAGELPFESEVFVRRALGDEDAAGGVFDQGADDGDVA